MMKLLSHLFKYLLLLFLLPSCIDAKTHIVTVGHYAFMFTPDIITADVGDVVEFQFPGQQYSIVRGAYASPCRPGVDTSSTSDGFDLAVWSGPVGGLEFYNTWSLHINDTSPIWYYECNRCAQSMVGVINPPSVGGSLEEWKTNYQVVTGGAGRPIPPDLRCPAGQKGGILAKQNALDLVQPVGPSATASPKGGEPPKPTEDSGAARVGAADAVVAVVGVVGLVVWYGLA